MNSPQVKTAIAKLLAQLKQTIKQPPLFAGKFLGLAAGYQLAGWVGALLGAFLGQSFDIKRRGFFSYLKDFSLKQWQKIARFKTKKQERQRQEEAEKRARQQRYQSFYQQQKQRQQQRNSSSSSHTYRDTRSAETRAEVQALRLLGAKSDASPSEIKTAYRRAMSANHPDKLIARKASAAAIDRAKQKTQAIQEAYALLKKAGKC